MAGIWVVAQHRQGQLHKMSLEALVAGQKLAAETGGELQAVVLGGDDAGGVAEELRGCGVAKVRLAQSAALADYTPGGYIGVLAAAIAAESPALVLFPQFGATRGGAQTIISTRPTRPTGTTSMTGCRCSLKVPAAEVARVSR